MSLLIIQFIIPNLIFYFLKLYNLKLNRIILNFILEMYFKIFIKLLHILNSCRD